MAEDSTHTSSIMQLLSGWELHVLILLSFSLQVFLFFCGGLRRRKSHLLLRITIWLSYLSADFIAAYALGYLSRNFPTTSITSYDSDHHKQITHQLTILWAPFLLIHLGGQNTVTAFSPEDNELWLRHLLNLLGQACLVVYVLWKWVALAQYQLIIPAAFLFVAGIIKYVERIWALKLGSQDELRTSTDPRNFQVPPGADHGGNRGQTYQEIIRYAHLTEQCVRSIFARSKVMFLDDYLMFDDGRFGRDTQVSFKRVEIELSIMYDSLFTKSRVIHTRPGGILWCVSLASTAVAFVLYVMTSSVDAEQTAAASVAYNFDYRRVDATITYILFIGGFLLEACSFFIIVMMSPWEWPFLEAGADGRWCIGVLLTRVAWPIFLWIQPETKPWWSNSMGQYNLLGSGYYSKTTRDKWSSTAVMAKMAGVFGVSKIWDKISNIKHAHVTMDIKELIHDSMGQASCPKCISIPRVYRLLLNDLAFGQALISLHLWTDIVMHKAASKTQEAAEEVRMDTCRRLSNYMMYLLVEHPAMLPVRDNTQDLLTMNSEWVNNVEGGFLESMATGYDGVGRMFWVKQRVVLENEGGIHAELEILEQVWVRMLLYAAAKSLPEEHARRLSTGGELITLVWLLLAHHGVGDVFGGDVSLMAATGFRSNNYLLDPSLT